MVFRFIFLVASPSGNQIVSISLDPKHKTQETHDTGNKVEARDVMVHEVFVTIDLKVHA